ncbi:AMIN domain-containing protein [Geitlerinema splendidum]|nr:AMIN domain-containing protein [Geitlerinema splendidum]
MKKYQGRGARATAAKAGLSTPSLGGLLIGGALTVMVAQPAWAAPTQITGVRINPTSTGIDLILETQAGDRPQVFAVPRGNSWVADVINAQLRIPEGTTFTRTNPAPGIASISIAPLDTNSVRVTITATDQAISGEVIRREATGIAFSISTGASAAVPPQIDPAPPPVTQAQPCRYPEFRMGPRFYPLAAQVVPPFLPRAIAPPVGDIAVSNIDATPGAVDLGVAELVPRLVLRDAPVRDVLALLARVANLNVAFAEGEALATPAAPGATGTGGDATISLDIENEPVQDVFNYVLRVTGLQSNRVGRTIFIGRNLPTGAQDLVMRTLRLNQLKATMAETNIESTMQTNVGIGSGVAAGGSQSTIARTVNQSRSVPMRGGVANVRATRSQWRRNRASSSRRCSRCQLQPPQRPASYR